MYRTTLDDVPIKWFHRKRDAEKCARSLTRKQIEKAHRVVGIDFCSSVNVCVYHFSRSGHILGMTIVADEFDDDGCPQPTTSKHAATA